MEFLQNAIRGSYLLRSIVSFLGASSLFWWSYISDMPKELRPFLGVLDARFLITELTVLAVVAIFFARVLFLFFFWFLTTIWDLCRTYPFNDFRHKYKVEIFRLNVFRRKFKRSELFFRFGATVSIFSIMTFGQFPWLLLIEFFVLSVVLLGFLKVLFFRVTKGYILLPWSMPEGVSPRRVRELWTSWAAMCILLFSVFLGSSLAEQKKSEIVCVELLDSVEEVAVFALTTSFLISVKEVTGAESAYSVVPLADIRGVTPCKAS